MQVADTLSRRKTAVKASGGESPGEKDLYFPYENEEVSNITFVNCAIIQPEIDNIYGYLADTEDERGKRTHSL